MGTGFFIKEIKNCRKYTKHVYELSKFIDQSFIEAFSFFGEPEITRFSHVNPKCHDLIKIRNYDFSFEMAGSYSGTDLIITYEKENKECRQLVENTLIEWFQANSRSQ